MFRLSSSWSLLAVASGLLIAAAVRLWIDEENADLPALMLLGSGLVTLGIWIGLETVRWVTSGKGRPDDEP